VDDGLASAAAVLADGIDAALPRWVVGCVERVMVAWHGGVPTEVRADATVAGEQARDDVMPRLRALLATDVDAQRGNPLELLRGAVRYPTEVLRRAGVPPVVRDEFAERAFADDVYDLTPASFAEIDASLHEPGLVWGAAKAHAVLARRRAEGKR
jgi:hypothetical protein